LVAVNSFFKDGNSGRIMKDIIAANNQWAWYQAKNVRSVIYETANRPADAERMKADMEEIKLRALALEADQKALSAKAPYYTYSAMLMQLGLVLSTAAILAVSMPLFYAVVAVGSSGVVLFAIALGV